MKTLIIQHIQLPLLAIGFFLRYLIGRRRFNRRSMAGLQHFKSYPNALLTLTIESVGKLFANALIVVAIIMLL